MCISMHTTLQSAQDVHNLSVHIGAQVGIHRYIASARPHIPIIVIKLLIQDKNV